MSQAVPPPGSAAVGWVRDLDGARREVRWDPRGGQVWVAREARWLDCGRARCVEDALRAAEAALSLH